MTLSFIIHATENIFSTRYNPPFGYFTYNNRFFILYNGYEKILNHSINCTALEDSIFKFIKKYPTFYKPLKDENKLISLYDPPVWELTIDQDAKITVNKSACSPFVQPEELIENVKFH